jgi:hypothetical protein
VGVFKKVNEAISLNSILVVVQILSFDVLRAYQQSAEDPSVNPWVSHDRIIVTSMIAVEREKIDLKYSADMI